MSIIDILISMLESQMCKHTNTHTHAHVFLSYTLIRSSLCHFCATAQHIGMLFGWLLSNLHTVSIKDETKLTAFTYIHYLNPMTKSLYCPSHHNTQVPDLKLCDCITTVYKSTQRCLCDVVGVMKTQIASMSPCPVVKKGSSHILPSCHPHCPIIPDMVNDDGGTIMSL